MSELDEKTFERKQRNQREWFWLIAGAVFWIAVIALVGGGSDSGQTSFWQ